uniref:Uncharacterized protein n=1 Tax=Oryza rufipogon TaxID=4529 RepID=A0A0E0PYW7_ORYRU
MFPRVYIVVYLCKTTMEKKKHMERL